LVELPGVEPESALVPRADFVSASRPVVSPLVVLDAGPRPHLIR